MEPQRQGLSETPPKTEREILGLVTEVIRARLPLDWVLDVALDPTSGSRSRADAMIRIQAPDGRETSLLVEAKRSVESRDLTRLNLSWPDADPLLASRYLSAPVRQRLEREGVSYVDATGNVFISLAEPGLFLRDVGAQRDPWRGPGRRRDSFRGAIAARVVRALTDYSPPLTVPELIKLSGVSTGAGYRMVEFLQKEDLLERDERGPITTVRWRPMLERWAQDYDLNLKTGVTRLLAPRGILAIRQGLRELDEAAYVLTGSMAASFFAEYAKPRLALIYTEEPTLIATRLDLRPVDSGANVLLVSPPDPVVFERAAEREGVRIAAPSQIAVDLLNGPGRAPAEGEALLDWMESNESAWRD